MKVEENYRPYGYLKKISFNDGKTILDLNEKSTVVFVGPNNVGKTQALRDIANLTKKDPLSKGTIIENLELYICWDGLRQFLNKRFTENTYINGEYLGQEISFGFNYLEKFTSSKDNFNSLQALFLARLNTINRLTICNPVEKLHDKQPISNPIQAAVRDKQKIEWLSESFKKAFKNGLVIDQISDANLRIRIGNDKEQFKIESNLIDAPYELMEKYEKLPVLDEQGDGYKSFVGILLYLSLDSFNIYLIDEPEAFLHPPQAKIMGNILGTELRDDAQLFISTHSTEILKGIVEAPRNEDLHIVRITRNGNKNSFQEISKKEISDLWSDPLLRHSNILDSIFYENVILTESESDSKMYSLIDEYLNQKEQVLSDTLFISCNGKTRIHKVLKALHVIGVNCSVIVDLDVLDNEGLFKRIINNKNSEIWPKIQSEYVTLRNYFSEPAIETIKRTELLSIFTTEDVTDEQMKKAKKLFKKTKNNWDSLKDNGVSAITDDDILSSYQKIEKVLRQYNIYVVPVGEIENFIPIGNYHGPAWVEKCLSDHPDLNDEVYQEIKSFIDSIRHKQRDNKGKNG